jgi:D-sedoheptulose 7-phosphate isomerase
MENEINRLITISAQHYQNILEDTKLKKSILQATEFCTAALSDGNRILLCGNGGSAADAQHIAAEFTGRFELERLPYAAIALTTDTSALTAIANDYGFEKIFTRQLAALGNTGDVLIAITTSGNSKNVISCALKAKEMGITVVSMTGENQGKIDCIADVNIKCPSLRTANIQEGHIMIGHIICKITEQNLAK